MNETEKLEKVKTLVTKVNEQMKDLLVKNKGFSMMPVYGQAKKAQADLDEVLKLLAE